MGGLSQADFLHVLCSEQDHCKKILCNRDGTQSFAGAPGEKQICIIHLFNGLDLKAGLNPPEGFEVANRKLS